MDPIKKCLYIANADNNCLAVFDVSTPGKSVPKGFSFILDFFKKYADESGYKAILSDSIMVIFACLFSSYFAGLSLNTNIIITIVLIYSIPFLIYQ
jgi:hypothetical protein